MTPSSQADDDDLELELHLSKKAKLSNLNSDGSSTMPVGKKTTTSKLESAAPLAEQMRPQSLDDFIGQELLVGPGSLLRGLIETGSVGSLVLVSHILFFFFSFSLCQPNLHIPGLSGAPLDQVPKLYLSIPLRSPEN